MKKTTHADPSGFFYQRTCREGLPEGRLAGALPGLPLTAAVLDRYCAPYICGYGAGARPVASLESFLRSDLRTLGMHPENPAVWDRFIDQLYIFNYREDPQGHPIPQSVGTCFGAGWWCASFRVSALFPEGNPLEHTEQAEALLALLGSPTEPGSTNPPENTTPTQPGNTTPTTSTEPEEPTTQRPETPTTPPATEPPATEPEATESPTEPATEPEETRPQLERVPTGCTYTTADGEEYGPGEEIPRAPVEWDVLTSADYTYTLRNNDWLVRVRDTSKTSYEELLPVVNGLALTYINSTFEDCVSMTQSPTIPNTVVSMQNTFRNCESLTEAPVLPNSLRVMYCTFTNCYNLIYPPEIPAGVKDMQYAFAGCFDLVEAPVLPEGIISLGGTFEKCLSLTVAPRIPASVVNMNMAFWCCPITEAPVLPENVVNLQYTFSGTKIVAPPVIPSSVQNMFGTFSDCHSLKRAPVIPENVTSLRSTFEDCWVLEGTIVINAKLPDYPQKPETIQSCFLNGGNSITLTGSCPYLQELADTATNGNVTVG